MASNVINLVNVVFVQQAAADLTIVKFGGTRSIRAMAEEQLCFIMFCKIITFPKPSWRPT